MPRDYHHLTIAERERIVVLRTKQWSIRRIATALRRDPGTISRELRRNAPPVHRGYYRAHRAQEHATARARQAHTYPRLRDGRLRGYARRMLRRGWSPERIAGRWRRLGHGRISHEAIYQWVYADARDLIPCLLRQHRRRWPRGRRHTHRASHIPARVPLAARPAGVAARRQAGHWEVDTMTSRASRTTLLIAAERVTRCTRIQRLPACTAAAVETALCRTLRRLPRGLRRTLTYDNGPENSRHQAINARLGTHSYFCEPYHSWEKGTVENTNGRIRRHFPKRTDFAKLPPHAVRRVVRWLNGLPMKCLDFQTPAEAFRQRVALTC
jgi:IS30 family transposase